MNKFTFPQSRIKSSATFTFLLSFNLSLSLSQCLKKKTIPKWPEKFRRIIITFFSNDLERKKLNEKSLLSEHWKKQFIDSFTLCLNRQSWIFDTWEGELLDSFLSCVSIVFPKVSWRKCIIYTKSIVYRKCDTQKAMRRLFLMNSTCHHHIITLSQILSMTEPNLLFIFRNNCTSFPF